MEFQVRLTRSAEQQIESIYLPKKSDKFFTVNQEPNIELFLLLEKTLYTFFMCAIALNRQSPLIHSILNSSLKGATKMQPTKIFAS